MNSKKKSRNTKSLDLGCCQLTSLLQENVGGVSSNPFRAFEKQYFTNIIPLFQQYDPIEKYVNFHQ